MADRITDERLRYHATRSWTAFDAGTYDELQAIATGLLAARAEVAEAKRLDGVRLSQIVSLQEIIRNDTTPAGVEVARFRAEVERLRGLIREYVQATDGLAVEDSAEAQNRYERAEDALREVARG